VKYQLRPTEGSNQIAASADLPDPFAAQTWAREWAQQNAAHTSYRLESTDGGPPALVFRTDYGQWYVMPLETASAGV
jgi:hypothetical protein